MSSSGIAPTLLLQSIGLRVLSLADSPLTLKILFSIWLSGGPLAALAIAVFLPGKQVVGRPGLELEHPKAENKVAWDWRSPFPTCSALRPAMAMMKRVGAMACSVSQVKEQRCDISWCFMVWDSTVSNSAQISLVLFEWYFSIGSVSWWSVLYVLSGVLWLMVRILILWGESQMMRYLPEDVSS